MLIRWRLISEGLARGKGEIQAMSERHPHAALAERVQLQGWADLLRQTVDGYVELVPGTFVKLRVELGRRLIRLAGGKDGNRCDCWLWDGSCLREGHGVVSAGGRNVLVHRLVFALEHGAIPPRVHIDHICRFRACFNPWHLEKVAPRVNILRGVSPPALAARQTRCKQGHQLTPDNVYALARGERVCVTCDRQRHGRTRVRGHYRTFGSARGAGGGVDAGADSQK